jgi:ADP-L-glycero-D-manno-heptose 6-epimerase
MFKINHSLKKIIITGTEGFIGNNLKKELEKNYIVHTINEDIFENDNWINLTIEKLKEINPEGIFHVGACSDTLETDVNYMMIRNYEFTKIISNYCSEFEVPLIYSSSAANYGINNLYPSNLYGWSKYVSEQYVIQNGGTALRYFNVYGPGEEHKGKMSSVAYQMFLKSESKSDIKLFPKSPKRDFVYINDVINANIFAYNNFMECANKYYEVGTGDARTFEDVLNIMEIPFTYASENEIPSGYQFFTQSNKSKWMNGWEPSYNIEMGLVEYKNYLTL